MKATRDSVDIQENEAVDFPLKLTETKSERCTNHRTVMCTGLASQSDHALARLATLTSSLHFLYGDTGTTERDLCAQNFPI